MNVGSTEKIRAIVWLAIWIVPIPFGAFVSDKSYFAPLSLLVFLLASISLPVTVRYRQIKRRGDSLYAPIPDLLYGSLIAMCIAIAVLNGCMSLAVWQSYGIRITVFFFWMLGTITLQTLLSWGIEIWKAYRRRHWYSEFLDPVLYSLPLPCALMGMFLFPAVQASDVTQSLVVGLMGILGFGFVIIGIFVIATFAFYFFPSKELRCTERLVQLVRIMVMAAVWLGIHSFIFDSKIQIFSTFIFRFMPLSQNNFLVFVTPFLLESIFIIVSVAISNLVVMLVHKMVK
ncbi:hypothetical protein [Megasphaera cerevisiae]|jgi:hypothetical protein|uniref:hypothetical protein n=1 Tax=Megasphaera cerevisiae TaxID=39029 RepID=UPI000943312C|nr:hypothetical protein [Megasphaera cerevisiae]MCI1750442.1 hypothetical protein [Megasphaera cerevisiae]OKY53019.1 hypothetical protein BSR42_09755 [Megasphaera cerevisiae]